MIGSIRRPSAQNPRISKKIRGFQIIAESSGGFAKSVRHQWITRPYRSRGHRSDRRRETFLLIPIVYRVNHAGNSGDHRKQDCSTHCLVQDSPKEKTDDSGKAHHDNGYNCSKLFHVCFPPSIIFSCRTMQVGNYSYERPFSLLLGGRTYCSISSSQAPNFK